MLSEDIQSISLYRHSGAKALLEPCSESSVASFVAAAASTNGNNTSKKNRISTAQVTPRGESSQRLKFTKDRLLWSDYVDGSTVRSHTVFLQMLAIQSRRGMQYICCADLNIRGMAAGTHFFQKNNAGQAAEHQVEIACIQLANSNNIRLMQMPLTEQSSLHETILRQWSAYGVRKGEGNVPVYRLNHHPWRASETTKNEANVDARKLIMALLSDMDQHGWVRAVPFQCTTNDTSQNCTTIETYTDTNTDSIAFFRYRRPKEPVGPAREFCAISLERDHKIRLIGGNDEKSRVVFENAVSKHWPQVKEINRFADNTQIKMNGQPWRPHFETGSLASARLLCGVLQDLWQEGWRWHCAVDLSCWVWDKSTLFLSRSEDSSMHDNMRGGQIACMQPKGNGSVNLVSFPPSVLEKVMHVISQTQWCTPLAGVKPHDPNCATCYFQNRQLHHSQRTDHKIVTAKVYTKLLRIIASAMEGTAMLGTCDMSANYHQEMSTQYSARSYSLDTDVFFFWFPSRS